MPGLIATRYGVGFDGGVIERAHLLKGVWSERSLVSIWKQSTSRISRHHDGSYIQYALHRCAKSGTPDFSDRTRESESIKKWSLLFDHFGVGALECESLERVQKIQPVVGRPDVDRSVMGAIRQNGWLNERAGVVPTFHTRPTSTPI